MKIAISGGTGLIGSRLVKEFSSRGWDIVILSRSDLLSEESLIRKAEDSDVIINLAGATIAQRWNSSVMKEIYDSRIFTTRNLVNAIHSLKNPPGLFISTSATGIYDSGGPYTESNVLLSTSFLGKVCQDWEREAFNAEDVSRLVVFRLGVVLDGNGGALSRLLPVFKAGLGGRIATGNQFFPWVHITDVVRAFLLVIDNKAMKGVYNLTAPQIITNKEFTGILAEVLHRPAVFTVPSFILRLLYGKGSIMLTEGQAVVPHRLQESGFSFHFPMMKMALKYTLKK